MRVFVYKSDGKLSGATSEDKDKIAKMPVGEPFEIEYKQRRNPKFNAKYWALIRLFLDNIPESFQKDLQNHQFQIRNKDDAHFYMKLKTGYIEKKFVDKKGNVAWVPKSIAFDKMDEMEFSEFYSKAVDVVCGIIGVEQSEILNELMEFL